MSEWWTGLRGRARALIERVYGRGAASTGAAPPQTAGDIVRGLGADLDARHPPPERPKRHANWPLRIIAALLVMAIGLPLFFVAAWRVFEPPFTWLMVERQFEGHTITRRPVKLDDISPHLVRAVIAAEDTQFCEHDGFDVEAIKAALENNKEGGKLRGGSTISQQTAKNIFLWSDRSWVRKGAEAYVTVLIEATWPKRRIMQAYLNAAEWGDGRFGAEAAAQGLFGKSAADLTPREAARLAAVLPSPNKWRADQPGPYVRRRAATIERRMGTVRKLGLDACVLDPRAPAKPATPRQDRALPPLPPPPVEGPEADPLVELAPPPQEAPLEGLSPPDPFEELEAFAAPQESASQEAPPPGPPAPQDDSAQDGTTQEPTQPVAEPPPEF